MFKGKKKAKPFDLIKIGSLKKHQTENVLKMKELESNVNAQGGILADDMGLGKTGKDKIK